MTARTVNVTPNWEATASMLILILENSNDEAKEFARAEIRRMGKIIDAAQKKERAK